MKLKDIEKYYSLNELKKPMQVDQCTYIENPKRTLKSLIIYMRGNRGNKRFIPYYELSIKIIKNDLSNNNPKTTSN